MTSRAVTRESLDQASLEESGPFFEVLKALQRRDGDNRLRTLALDLIRAVPHPHHGYPAEFLELLVQAIAHPERSRDELRPFMADNSAMNREAAKLFFEWGGAERMGDRLVRQVATLCSLHTAEHDESALEFLRARLFG